MTYHVSIPLWDFAAITVRLIADCLDTTPGTTTKYHVAQARGYMRDFVAECSTAYSELETTDAKEAMQRATILLRELESLSLSTMARNAVQEFVLQANREWCEYEDHLAEVRKSCDYDIYGGKACQDCYEEHLEQLKEDEEFEQSNKPPYSVN